MCVYFECGAVNAALTRTSTTPYGTASYFEAGLRKAGKKTRAKYTSLGGKEHADIATDRLGRRLRHGAEPRALCLGIFGFLVWPARIVHRTARTKNHRPLNKRHQHTGTRAFSLCDLPDAEVFDKHIECFRCSARELGMGAWVLRLPEVGARRRHRRGAHVKRRVHYRHLRRTRQRVSKSVSQRMLKSQVREHVSELTRPGGVHLAHTSTICS